MAIAENMALFIATIFSGLVAGLMYGVVITVNRGLSAITDNSIYIAAHNSINRVITPLNSLVFVTSIVLIIATAVVYVDSGASSSFWLILAATIFYLPGVLGATLARSMPLSAGLWKVDPGKASFKEMAEIRAWHEKPWHLWHNLRTAISTLVFVLITIALL